MPKLLLAIAFCAASALHGQSTPSPSQAPPRLASGTVLFSGPVDARASSATVSNAGKATVTVTERTGWTVTAYDLDVHLNPDEASLAVEARLTFRNDAAEPLARLPLQLSSTLHMERVSLAGVALPLTRHPLASDADHTGDLEETVAALPAPLAPGAAVTVAAAYAGTIRPSSARLERLKTPAEAAASADWDRISPEFTGLRGFGQVVWYPVVSIPALLGDEAKLFAEVERQRLRGRQATIAIRLTEEFTGAPPTFVVLAGHVVPLGKPELMPTEQVPGVVRAQLATTGLGFQFPSLFLGAWPVGDASVGEASAGVRVYHAAAHASEATNYRSAAALAQPLLARWLGATKAGAGAIPELAIFDLPLPGAQPTEQGQALMASLVEAPAEEIAPLLAQELARMRFRSPRLWLEQGVPAFLGALATEQQRGREAALEQLAASQGALAFAEPASPGAGAGQDLLHASDPIYYRAKALDVLWMLRDLAGDASLAQALTTYDPAADTQDDTFERLIEKASGKDLRWFFDAWVYRDLGLPDLSLANVFSTRTGAEGDQWLVTVDLANDGYADAEVPVTVHSQTATVTERVRVAGRGKISHRLLVVGKPVSVEVNDGSVPEVGASIHHRELE